MASSAKSASSSSSAAGASSWLRCPQPGSTRKRLSCSRPHSPAARCGVTTLRTRDAIMRHMQPCPAAACTAPPPPPPYARHPTHALAPELHNMRPAYAQSERGHMLRVHDLGLGNTPRWAYCIDRDTQDRPRQHTFGAYSAAGEHKEVAVLKAPTQHRRALRRHHLGDTCTLYTNAIATPVHWDGERTFACNSMLSCLRQQELIPSHNRQTTASKVTPRVRTERQSWGSKLACPWRR